MKHVLTGAGSGIGLALAQRLADRGDDLVLVARSDARATELADTFAGAQVLVADLADPGTLNGIGRQVDGPVDSLVHVAGVVELGRARAPSETATAHAAALSWHLGSAVDRGALVAAGRWIDDALYAPRPPTPEQQAAVDATLEGVAAVPVPEPEPAGAT